MKNMTELIINEEGQNVNVSIQPVAPKTIPSVVFEDPSYLESPHKDKNHSPPKNTSSSHQNVPSSSSKNVPNSSPSSEEGISKSSSSSSTNVPDPSNPSTNRPTELDPMLSMFSNQSFIKENVPEDDIHDFPNDHSSSSSSSSSTKTSHEDELPNKNAKDDVYVEYDPVAEAAKIQKEKNELLTKLDLLEKDGHQLPKRFNHDSDIEEMRSVFERISGVARAEAGVQISQKLLIGFVGCIEWMNNRYDPFGAKLDGWGNSVMSNIDEFNNVLGRVWEKYGGAIGEVNPLFELIFALSLSAIMYHFTQRMVEQSTRQAEEAIRQQNVQEQMRRQAERMAQQSENDRRARRAAETRAETAESTVREQNRQRRYDLPAQGSERPPQPSFNIMDMIQSNNIPQMVPPPSTSEPSDPPSTSPRNINDIINSLNLES
jgi:hypothetical protein